jgi:hypothetical protein
MSTDKIDPSKKADDLVKSGDAQLSEEELKRVTGGVSLNFTKIETTPSKMDPDKGTTGTP